MIRNIKFIILLIIFSFVSCKPYNSSEANKKLLQGEWYLADIRYNNKDSIQHNMLCDTVRIILKGDSIEERINGNICKYTFKINKYNIAFQLDSVRIHYGYIMSLSKDTFKMRSQAYERTYVKKE